MAWIDQIGCDARLFEQLVDWDPKDPGRLHRHGVDATGEEPGDESVQISRKGLKHSYRLRIALGRDRNNDFFAANIQTSSIGMDTGEFIQRALAMGGC